MDPKIFRKYDIRGLAEGDDASVTPEAARLVGLAFATYLQRFEHKNVVVVGRDNRRSSYLLSRALIEGLRSSGCTVVDIDLVATPIVHWQAIRRGDVGGVMITGSHLDPSYNGFKLCIGSRNIYGSQLQLIRSFIQSGDLTYGDGKVTTDHSSYSKYVEDLTQRLPMARPLNVVIDTGNGIAGLFAPRLIKAWGHNLLDCLYCELDSRFPNRRVNLMLAEATRTLSEKVCELKADIGIAFDVDVDSLRVVDERGELIAPDRVLAMLARDMLSRNPGATVVADVLTSKALYDEVARSGGKAVMSAGGHAPLKARLMETRALLGGTMSGHVFACENYYGYDDGFFAAGRVLQMLAAASDMTLSEMDKTIPRLYSTPEYRPHCPDNYKQTAIEGVQKRLKDKGEMITLDGIRVNFERGWGVLRASNTEPVLSLRFEGETAEDAMAYRDLFAEALRHYPLVAPLIVSR